VCLKNNTLNFDYNFGKSRQIYNKKFFHYQIPEEILYTSIVKILHLTLSMFQHYLVKLDNYNCCRL